MDGLAGLVLKLAFYFGIFYVAIMISAKLFVSKGIIGDILNIIHFLIRKIVLIVAIGLVAVFIFSLF